MGEVREVVGIVCVHAEEERLEETTTDGRGPRVSDAEREEAGWAGPRGGLGRCGGEGDAGWAAAAGCWLGRPSSLAAPCFFLFF